MDRINDIMGRWNRHRDIEVYLTTYDGEQHLRLHGWLKRNRVPVRSENILNEEDCFGVFTVLMTEEFLDKIKEENTEKGLFIDLEIMDSKKASFNDFNNPQLINEKTLQSIQEFLFNFSLKDKGDIEKFLKEANETSLALFKKNKDFINDYVETEEMSQKDKLKDLEIMIEAFVEEERYEDCALLVKVKKKVIKHYKKQLN
jgi:hypothetical protein